MDITTFLAQIWGPILLAVGAGVFISRTYYVKIYRELEKETLAVLLFGMTAMAVGIVHTMFHNVWDTLPQMVVSLLGWALFVKGTVFVIIPRMVDWGGDWVADSKLISFVGVLMLVVAVYLSWFGYFA